MQRLSSALILLWLTGCAGLSAPQTVNQTLHVLDTQPAVQPAAVQRNIVLLVNSLPARPGYDTSQMVYTIRPHELGYFATNRWVAPPARMLEPLLVSALGQTRAFRAVAPATETLAGDLRLDVEVLQLHQNFSTRPSQMVLGALAQLVDLRTQRILATRQFDETEAATSDDAKGGAAAANRALPRLLGKVAEFCVSESGSR